jgi:hypothetical protein
LIHGKTPFLKIKYLYRCIEQYLKDIHQPMAKKVKNGASSARAKPASAAYVYRKFKHINNHKVTVPEASRARDSKVKVAKPASATFV